MDQHTNIDAVQRPIDQANGLPNAHYIDPTVFEEEKHALLFAGWAGLGVAADVPEIGDAVPLTFLGMPLLMVRDKSGAVRVFQNTCRHRGMILVSEAQQLRDEKERAELVTEELRRVAAKARRRTRAGDEDEL